MLLFLQSWIISHFHRIHGFEQDIDYTDNMPKAVKHVLHRGNHQVVSYRVYIDCTNHDDIKWTSFNDYMDIVPFDPIS